MFAKDCFSNFLTSIETLRSLGFTIHPNKSKFESTQCITYLGFNLNSIQMIMALIPEMKEKKLDLALKFLEKTQLL